MNRPFVYAILACAAFWAVACSAAFADEAKPAPKCATVAECVTKIEALEKSVAEATAAYQGVRSQRDAALSGQADSQLAAYLAQQKK